MSAPIIDGACLEGLARAIRPAAFQVGAAPVWRALAFRDAANVLGAMCAKPGKGER